jgi:hypothetical protein
MNDDARFSAEVAGKNRVMADEVKIQPLELQ